LTDSRQGLKGAKQYGPYADFRNKSMRKKNPFFRNRKEMYDSVLIEKLHINMLIKVALRISIVVVVYLTTLVGSTLHNVERQDNYGELERTWKEAVVA
jgi:hypothetical protein